MYIQTRRVLCYPQSARMVSQAIKRHKTEGVISNASADATDSCHHFNPKGILLFPSYPTPVKNKTKPKRQRLQETKRIKRQGFAKKSVKQDSWLPSFTRTVMSSLFAED